jgi:uncharacterized protein with GYD domain
MVLGGPVARPIADAPEVLRFVNDFAADVTVWMSARKETVMPVYISLVKWTDQGRAKASSLPDPVAEVDKRIEALGGRSIGNWLTMGRFDQVAVVEAPDDETAAKLLMGGRARERRNGDAPSVHHG